MGSGSPLFIASYSLQYAGVFMWWWWRPQGEIMTDIKRPPHADAGAGNKSERAAAEGRSTKWPTP